MVLEVNAGLSESTDDEAPEVAHRVSRKWSLAAASAMVAGAFVGVGTLGLTQSQQGYLGKYDSGVHIKTSGGFHGEGECLIPFIYEGETYYDCTTAGGGAPWCSVADDTDDGTSQWWGVCKEHDPTTKEQEAAAKEADDKAKTDRAAAKAAADLAADETAARKKAAAAKKAAEAAAEQAAADAAAEQAAADKAAAVAAAEKAADEKAAADALADKAAIEKAALDKAAAVKALADAAAREAAADKAAAEAAALKLASDKEAAAAEADKEHKKGCKAKIVHRNTVCRKHSLVTVSATKATDSPEKCMGIVLDECRYKDYFMWRKDNKQCHCVEQLTCDNGHKNKGLHVYQITIKSEEPEDHEHGGKHGGKHNHHKHKGKHNKKPEHGDHKHGGNHNKKPEHGGNNAEAPTTTTSPYVCASGEDATCACDGTVYYGRKFVKGRPGSGKPTTFDELKLSAHKTKATTGNVACSSGAMGGDPLYGFYKYCFCENEAPTTTTSSYVCASGEDATCACDGTVYYGRKFVKGRPGSGKPTTFDELKLSAHKTKATTGSVACSSGAMGGDPLFGFYKYCFCEKEEDRLAAH